MSTKHTHHRLLGAIVLAAALVTPAAAAGDPTLRNDVAHYGNVASPERLNPTSLNDAVHNQSAPAAIPATPAAIVVELEGGFDWISAGIGAAGATGLVLVLGATGVTLRRRQVQV